MDKHPTAALQGPDSRFAAAAAALREAARRAWRETHSAGTQLAVPAALLLLWQAAASLGWMPSQILPSPLQVAHAAVEMAGSGELQANVSVSLQRIALGALLGVLAGLALGSLLGASDRAQALLGPTLRALFAVPSLGWIPILVLVFGIDEIVKVLIISKAVLVPVTIATSQGLRDVPQRYLEVARVLRLSRLTRWRRLVWPASLPAVVSGIRLGLGHAFIALIVVEMLAATEGLGYMMVWGRKIFQLDIVVASMITVGAAGFLLDRLLCALEALALRWRPGHE